MTKLSLKTAIAGLATTALASTAWVSVATADPVDDNLVINEEIEIVTKADAPAHLDGALDEVLSGWLFRGTETRAMEMDDFDNPGMIFVEQAEDVWNAAEGTAGKSCSSCHEGSDSMAGVRAVYPKWNEGAGARIADECGCGWPGCGDLRAWKRALLRPDRPVGALLRQLP